MKIVKINKIVSQSKRYDIQTSTANFFANEILVHNSMIRTIPVNGGEQFRLGTRAGITNVSMAAEKFWVRPENYERYQTFFEECEDEGLTPIFEYVGPNNRIVLHYAEENLILTAIRERESGEYMQYDDMVGMSSALDIPYVEPLFDSSENLVDRVAKLQGLEGCVVRFEDGFMVKCKADDYVDKHRAIGQLKFEKDVLKLIFTNNLDDVLPILNDDVRKQVETYRSKVVEASQNFNERLHEKYDQIFDSFSEAIQDLDERDFRREFALAVNGNERWKRDGKFLFNMMDRKEIDIPAYIVSKCGSQAGVDSIRHIIGVHKLWNMVSEEE
jgi:T4 RnlA family RNA ligase